MKARAKPHLAFAYYSTNPVAFINDWCFTVDPRNVGTDRPTFLPFRLFQRQEDMVLFFQQIIDSQSAGLVEKSRDMGATWTTVAFSVWLWLFRPGAAIGFGSRKELLVDRLGDMDSIFEKIRYTIKMLPGFLLPRGFDLNKNCSYMKLLNPETNSSITGEAGDNIGRGGRKLIYFKDESGHYDHAEMIEAALMDNTNTQVDISSVNGTGNVFHRRRMSGEEWTGQIEDKKRTQVFIMDWRDHPGKDQEWYDARKQKAEADGLNAEFAREVDRSYTASILGTVIKAEWVEAAFGLADDFELDVSGKKRCGLDVGDDGISGDKNAWCYVHGLQIEDFETWGLVDTGITAQRSYNYTIGTGCNEIQYDSIGVGSGAKGGYNTMRRENKIRPGFIVVPWVASGKLKGPWEFVDRAQEGDLDHQGPLNKDFFGSFTAQAWWSVRKRFFNAWRCRQGLSYDKDNIVSINPEMSNEKRRQIVSELSQAVRKETTAGKMVIDKAPNGARSPNVADAVIIALFPALQETVVSEDVMF